MKKTKRSQEAKPAPPARAAPRWWPPWWIWCAALAGLFVVFEAYTPALNGGFVLDDRYLPFFAPRISEQLFSGWVGGLRPLLMFSFWIDHQLSGTNPYTFHATNVFIHFLTSTLATLIAARLLEWAGVAGRMRAVLAIFCGGLFLLHPIQTESVAYVASRSENLSVLFYFAAFTVFLYKPGESITLARTIAVVALFGAAVGTKEHTLTLPALLLMTDCFWRRGGIRKNIFLYGVLAIAGAAGAAFVWKILRTTNTAGFRVEGATPVTYFFTQCRVVWTYVRMFFIPYGQNIDADVPLSRNLLDHGAILGLAALIAVVAAAWVYRKRFPLAAFGVFMFLLLIAPTSSFVPIKDVLAERRVYLPFLGLALVCLEALRRLTQPRVVWTAAAVLTTCTLLTYQRNQVWASPLTLWEDSVAKAPHKWRPRFQLAFAQYEANRCPDAARSYEKASRLGPVDDQLLIDWALALECSGQVDEAIEKLRQALKFGATAHVYSQIGMVNAKHGRTQAALDALAAAENLDPRYDMIFVYRGNIYERGGDRISAAREYRHAVEVNPSNQEARDDLLRVSR